MTTKTLKEVASEVKDFVEDYSTWNIYKKMLAIQSEMGYVAKNLNVAASPTRSYKAVGEVDVLEAVKELEKKYGVYSYPIRQDIVDSKEIATEKGSKFFLRLKVFYKFVNVDKPEECISMEGFYGVGIDSGDKATGKAMTYAGKYALMKAYKISTGDDPDQEASPEPQPKAEKKAEVKPMASQGQIGWLQSNLTVEQLQDIYTRCKVTALKELTQAQAKNIIEHYSKKDISLDTNAPNQEFY